MMDRRRIHAKRPAYYVAEWGIIIVYLVDNMMVGERIRGATEEGDMCDSTKQQMIMIDDDILHTFVYTSSLLHALVLLAF